VGEASLGFERAYGRQFLDHRVCRERVDVLVSVRPSVLKKNEEQDAGMTRAEVPGRWKRVDHTAIKIQEIRSDCAHRASRMRQHEWEDKDRWVGVDCDR
jgi:hypothetical protein